MNDPIPPESEESDILSQALDQSQATLVLINATLGMLLPEDKTLKHFVMWTVATKLPGNAVHLRHRVASNWNQKHAPSMKVLTRLLLSNVIRKIGIPAVEEILTDIKLGGKIDDSQDNFN